MDNLRIYHYDSFTSTPNMGNPAGVVMEADHLDHHEMLAIAKKVGFNETVFVLESAYADLKLQFFTPGHEINLCGHATIAALYCLKSRGLIVSDNITIETNIGILPITFSYDNGILIKMKQGNPQFTPFGGSIEQLFQTMGLTSDAYDSEHPIVYGSTGTWTLLIPVKNLSSFSNMKPYNHLFPDVLSENPKASIHPFCLQSFDKGSQMHARHFSSPYSGTVEDPVTGTASGVMGAYYLTYIKPELHKYAFTVEQGQEMNKDGRVYVEVNKQSDTLMEVFISGTAVYVGEIHYDSE
ncbi:PhzF family phenazine biosynthesis isomerase [Paenibacillus sp. GSMTC-2017]|uniref:PhzF family phenazine biosynthesis protein n=1 Tax=Paenibacillus sp. GSMTC-2017 TaxID=2794350 RepID=UPI0018D7C075|nr:PhzF family phenazine biosynthesis isomerase [Paenibacillus sp. GSMTC-2017]MBH5317662.1 PhzF family phenazine biosynthesis isomerase [Paenibacillus sp. GSMTC-2017]